MSDTPMVSVAMVTYNHRPFIAQALESVLAQRRDFPIEIVIGDDCSPDGTGKVVDEYQARFPGLFVRRDPERNVGGAANMARVWASCRGKYIALLEGDDWWAEDKLAVQVEFMEKHPECTISGHTVTHVGTDGTGRAVGPVGWPEVSDIRLLIKGSCLMTCSILCRRGIVTEIPDWSRGLVMGDWPLCLLHAAHGRIGYIHRPLGFYRIHAGGIWSPLGLRRQLEHLLRGAQTMREKFPRRFAKLFEGAIGHLHFLLFQATRDDGDYRAARRHLWRSCVHRFRGRELTFDMLYKVPLRMLFPNIG